MPYRRKLIEVALPLEAINAESAREKSIRHGHPSTLHLWWARRPLAACRAVLFSSLVDDPSEYMSDEDSADAERERLFKIIEDLVKWENINNEEVLDKARLEIARSVARDLGVDVPVGKQAIREFLATQAPPVLDPFAGGGSIPLEAQRLGLRAYASDLNPVAVLINKALIEIPPRFAGMPPVHPPEEPKAGKNANQSELWKKEWKGAEGLAEDVRYYGKWMRDEAYKRIGHLYPPVTITAELLAVRSDLKSQGLKPGDELTVIAWLWARTVKCPNPACGAQMPLVRSFALSTKKGKQAWIDPVINQDSLPTEIGFTIKVGEGTPRDGIVNRNGAYCIACGTPVPLEYIRHEGQVGKISSQMLAIIAIARGVRVHLPPNEYQVSVAKQVTPNWEPEQELQGKCTVSVPLYGMRTFGDLFTDRQLTSLVTLSDLIIEARNKILEDANKHFRDNAEALSYTQGLVTLLAEAVSKLSTFHNTLAYWRAKENKSSTGFGRQAIAMTWDYTETNPFAGAGGDIEKILTAAVPKVLEDSISTFPEGHVMQQDAGQPITWVSSPIISTDPPYYDNVCYADLSDFFYVWLRRSLGSFYPDLFSTLLTPKSVELIASPFRFETPSQSEAYFEEGLRKVFENIRLLTTTHYPVTVYYAFKQSEGDNGDEPSDSPLLKINGNARASTGWETMLQGLLTSGFQIMGTWPLRTETTVALKAKVGALASSILLVCRPRTIEGSVITRRDFLAALNRELPSALRQLQQGSIAPVDLAQAAIGPGMAVFSRYQQVLESDGSPMRVRIALALINQALDEFFSEQEGEFEGDTRWALAWYEQFGHEQGPYGVAETLSKAKNTSVEGLVEAGFLEARAGKVRLLRRDELDTEWDPQKDKRPTAWEACQHLIYDLDKSGEQAAAALLAKLGSLGETARDLAYRLYTVCERKGWAQDALGYNMLVVAWPRLKEMARGKAQPGQGKLF